MGTYAAEELLRGNSNVVVCERNGKIVSTDINYALMLDKKYKGTLKEGDLDPFTPDQLAKMDSDIEEKKAYLLDLFTVENKINL